MVQDQAAGAAYPAAPAKTGLLKRIGLDGVLLLLLALFAAGAALYGQFKVNDAISYTYMEVWFDADVPRAYRDMSDRWADHFRTEVHPLFPLLTYPPTRLAQKALGLGPLNAVRLVMAGVAFLWMGLLFVLLRLMGLRRLDAVLFSALAGVSAGWLFWFSVPETYAWGSLTIVLTLALVGLKYHRNVGEAPFIAASALTLSMTLSNWLVGILAAFAHFPRRRALQITANALAAVVLLWAVQKVVFPSSNFFLGGTKEQNYLFRTENGGPAAVVRSFLFHTVVMPAPREVTVDLDGRPAQALVTQPSPLGSGSPFGLVACALWLGLLGLGVWAAAGLKEQRRLVFVCGVALVGQLCLHLLYGNETFLYALNFLPLFLVLVSLGTLTRARPLVLGLLTALIVCAAVNNVTQFRRAVDYFRQPAPTAQAGTRRVAAAAGPSAPGLRPLPAPPAARRR